MAGIVPCPEHIPARALTTTPAASPARPRLSKIQVLPDWDPPEEVPFSVQIQNFYPRDIHRVEWSCDGKVWERSAPIEVEDNVDSTFTATSLWRVPSRCLTQPEPRVRVSVQHSPGDAPVEEELSLRDAGE